MIHGLMWLPLLAIFTGLAWAGWNEYQKVEAYRVWSDGAQRAKYDIRAALIQRGDQLMWGRPTRSGIVEVQTFEMPQLDRTAIAVIVEGKAIALDDPSPKGNTITLTLAHRNGTTASIPFTDPTLAIQWAQALAQDETPSVAI